jgi:four helix bundle protein
MTKITQMAEEARTKLRVAYGSLQETETLVILATRLGYCQDGQETQLLKQTEELGKLFNGLINGLRRRS